MIEFGELLNNEPDPSSSPTLEFFVIACLPDGDTGNALARNQEYAIDVLLSPKLPNIRKAIQGVFGHGAMCEAPEKICDVIIALIAQGNLLTAAQLQANDLTLEHG